MRHLDAQLHGFDVGGARQARDGLRHREAAAVVVRYDESGGLPYGSAFGEHAKAVRGVDGGEGHRGIHVDSAEAVPVVEGVAGCVGDPGVPQHRRRAAEGHPHSRDVSIKPARRSGEDVFDVAPGEIGLRLQQQGDGARRVGSGG